MAVKVSPASRVNYSEFRIQPEMDNNSRALIMPTAEPFLFTGGKIGCLLIHGYTGTPREMRLMGDYLKNYGYTILCPRLPGHARSMQDLNHFKWQDWLCTIEDGIHLLRENCEKICVIGLSMGAMLAIIAAERYDVDGLVAISTPYRLPYERWIKFAPLIKYFIPSIGKGKSDWNDPSNAVGHTAYPGWPTANIVELQKVEKSMHRAASRVKVPALLVQSTHDSAVPEEHVHLHYRDLGSRDKNILVVQNSGHNIPRDTDREIVFKNIVQFIQRISEN